MTEPTLYLEAADDLSNVLLKVDRIKSSDFILVIPKGSVLMHSALNLKILKRYLSDQGRTARLAIADRIGNTFAEQAGFELANVAQPEPVVQSYDNPITTIPEAVVEEEYELESSDLSEAPEEPTVSKYGRWTPPKLDLSSALTRSASLTKFRLRLSRQHQITLGLVLLGLIILASVGYFVVPKATATLEVQSEPFKKQFAMILADEQDLQAAGANVLTGRFIEVTHENVSTFSATGEQNNGAKAEGKITVVNYTGSIAGLLANTRFKAANGMTFRIKGDVLVAPARSNVPGKTTIDAVADEGGTKYNISPPLKLTVPGLGATAQELIYGEIAVPFTGGTDEIKKVVSQEDIDKAKEAAAKDVFVAAEADLQKQLKRGEEINPAFIQNDVIDSTPNTNVGSTIDQFEMRVQSRSWTIAIKKNVVKQAIANAALAEVPEGKEITQRTIDSAKIDVVEGNFLTHRVNLLISLDGRVGPRLELPIITSHLVNQSVANGKTYLQGLTEVASSDITLWPSFIPRIPFLPSNVKIDVVYLGE